MKALIIGATGATGNDLVNVLLKDPNYTKVTTFVRRTSGKIHPKLSEILIDFDKLEEAAAHIEGDILFSCLGTTLKVAGSKENQYHIDYEIPLKFSEIAHEKGITRIVLLSAHGASTSSKVFYSKTKGKLEEDTAQIGFDQYIIFRPGLLLRKNTDRFAERIAASALKLLNSIGLVKKFQPLDTALLAQKMAKAPKVLDAGKHIVALDRIFDF